MSTIPAILGCVLLAPLLIVLFSIDAVEQNEYGLKFNWVTKSLSKDVYHGGTHMVGFWNKFLVFPATVRSIEFSDRIGMSQARMLHTRTKEGLALHLSISFQYKLNPERLHELFAVTNMAYENLYIRIAREQLLEAASEYEGPQYWQERQKIGDHMRQLVDANLKDNYASLWGLQLQVIDLPDRYEQTITETQVQQQIIRTRQNEQVAAGIRADTDVLTAEFDKKIQVVVADAMANYTKETKLANAEATKRRITAEAETVGYVRKKLKLSAADLVRYQQLQSYSQMANASFMVDLPQASAMIGLGAGLMQQTRQAPVAEPEPEQQWAEGVATAAGATADKAASAPAMAASAPAMEARQPTSFMERKWRRTSDSDLGFARSSTDAQ